MSVFNKNTRRVLSYDVRKRGMTKRVVSAGVGIDLRLRRIKSASQLKAYISISLSGAYMYTVFRKTPTFVFLHNS